MKKPTLNRSATNKTPTHENRNHIDRSPAYPGADSRKRRQTRVSVFSIKTVNIADYKELLKAASEADIVFFGELHDNSLCHWLELELTKDLYEARKEKLVLGAEMFETDNQLLVNEYVTQFIRKKDFEAEAKLWPNYRTDYAPLVDFAREKETSVCCDQYSAKVCRHLLIQKDLPDSTASTLTSGPLSLRCQSSTIPR